MFQSPQMEDTWIPPDPFPDWYARLEKRHLSALTFQEVRKSVQALSAGYVERRCTPGRAINGAGKRAAFAMFYGPLHFLTIRAIVRGLGADKVAVRTLIDLGCGTGVAGAAWSIEARFQPVVQGIERHSWAAVEARWTYRTLGVRGAVQSADLAAASLAGAGRGTAIVAAYVLSELGAGGREALRTRLLEAARLGASLLIVEPIARRLAPWWDQWTDEFRKAGARVDDWRTPAQLPESLQLMDRAARLDHRELTARSLWLRGGGRDSGPGPCPAAGGDSGGRWGSLGPRRFRISHRIPSHPIASLIFRRA
jgi:hypothetical protein